jgi:UDP-glucose 4-epimerase
MRLLLTGAAGFLGRNVLLAAPASWNVVAVYRPGSELLPAFVVRHALAHVRPVACDLTDGAQVAWVARELGGRFDACLYLAANTSIPASVDTPAGDLLANTLTLLNVLEHVAIGHLVFLSSGAVYLGHTGLVSPETPVAPALPYAISKLAAERYVAALETLRGNPVCATVLRFFGAYGPYEPPRKLYTRLVRRFAFERTPRFMVTGDGENLIDAMYVEDAVRALCAVLTRPPEGVLTLDLGVGGRQTVNQVVAAAARTFGLEAEIAHTGAPAEYITFHIDPRPFQARYGVVPAVPLEAGLRRLATHLSQEADDA